jgi:anti-sigma regulatory factor (Ser/Thr protein kinase)
MARLRIDLPAITQWITAASLQHPHDLASEIASRTGLRRASAHKAIQRLVAAQWLASEGTPRRPHHRPGPLRQVVQRYTLAGLQEDLPWSRDFAPFFTLPAQVARMAQHAFTELLNNAIDHSEGSSVAVSMRQTPSHVQLLVSDDGRGLFDKISEAFDIPDPALAVLELSKGKLTSQPERHTGRGLYFSSKLADVFDLQANATAFQQRDWDRSSSLRERPAGRPGTSVFIGIALDTQRTLDQVLRAHSLDGVGYGFERTVVPMRLLATEHSGLESRAQARRAAMRLQQFRRAEMDFDGIADIGHGFADELFRVFTRECPNVELVPVNMAPRVAALVSAVRAGTA